MFTIIKDEGLTVIMKCSNCGHEKSVYQFDKKRAALYPCDCEINAKVGAVHGPYVILEMDVHDKGGRRKHVGKCTQCNVVRFIRHHEIVHRKLEKCFRCERKPQYRTKKAKQRSTKEKDLMDEWLDKWYDDLTRNKKLYEN